MLIGRLRSGCILTELLSLLVESHRCPSTLVGGRLLGGRIPYVTNSVSTAAASVSTATMRMARPSLLLSSESIFPILS